MPWHKDLKPAQFVLIKVFKVSSRAIGTHLTSLINYLDLCGCLNFVSYCSEELHNCKFPCIFLALFGNKRYHFFSVIPLTARCTRYIYGRGDCINLKTLGCARMHSRKWASAYILCSLKEKKNSDFSITQRLSRKLDWAPWHGTVNGTCLLGGPCRQG